MARRPPIVLAFLASTAALAAAGCGGNSNPPSVASLGPGSTTTTTSTSTNQGSRSNDPGSAPGGGSAHFQLAMNVGSAALGAKFASCMRSHGVTNFPDPNSQGVIKLTSGMGVDPNSPTFRSARTACQKLLPNGGEPTAAEKAQMQQKMLGFSKCMRAHGIKDFPDPTDGGLRLHAGQGSDLDPENPQFQRAQQACQGMLPFKGGTTGAGAK